MGTGPRGRPPVTDRETEVPRRGKCVSLLAGMWGEGLTQCARASLTDAKWPSDPQPPPACSHCLGIGPIYLCTSRCPESVPCVPACPLRCTPPSLCVCVHSAAGMDCPAEPAQLRAGVGLQSRLSWGRGRVPSGGAASRAAHSSYAIPLGGWLSGEGPGVPSSHTFLLSLYGWDLAGLARGLRGYRLESSRDPISADPAGVGVGSGGQLAPPARPDEGHCSVPWLLQPVRCW